MCAALAAGLGGRGRCLFSLFPSLTSLAVRVAGCTVRVSVPLACRYAIPCGLCVPQARSGCPSRRDCVSVGCGCARAPAVFAPLPPPRVGVARALRRVPVQGASRAVPGGSCPSAFPAPFPCSASLALGGLARSLGSLAWLGVCRPPPNRPALVCCLCALWGRHEGARGGGALAWVWGVRGWALSQHPTARPWGARLGPATNPLWCGRCGRGDPSPTRKRALL